MDSASHFRTALITGASSGLGAEFARQLGHAGYNLVISARREDRMRTLGLELINRYGIQVQQIPADLSTEVGIARLETRLHESPTIDLLINNAGFGGKDNFASIDLQRHLNMLRVHVEAPMRLTHAVLPFMMKNNYGGVINVASISAFFPMRSVNYSATKAYLVNLSQALGNELIGTNVTIQALCPGFTHTEFHDERHNLGIEKSKIPSWLWLSVESVVSESIRSISKGSGLCIPGFHYKLIAFLGRSAITSYLLQALWRLLRKYA